MPLSPSKISALRKKAKNGVLDVEHLLYVAKHGDSHDCQVLMGLSEEFNWSHTDATVGTYVTPLSKWADMVCIYLQKGADGLIKICQKGGGESEIAIGILEELKSVESIAALLAIGGKVIFNPKLNIAISMKLAQSFNLILSFKNSPHLDLEKESTIRNFLHKLIEIVDTEAARAIIICALRGVGDVTSLGIIENLPSFNGAWKGLKSLAIKEIELKIRRKSY